MDNAYLCHCGDSDTAIWWKGDKCHVSCNNCGVSGAFADNFDNAIFHWNILQETCTSNDTISDVIARMVKDRANG